ncbi:MAG: protein-L-isoaspartate(D-aspartate) O-methyltransferase [Actinobacteria bacterium]|nr:MAG: protein-L-isoaspartate(D-aspartate) O-methyltransferase [Actinomycetota bacterium]
MKTSSGNALRERYVAVLIHGGYLRDPAWIQAFHIVPRHVFTPRIYRPVSEGDYGRFVAVPPSDPGWLDAIYRDDVLITQIDGDDQLWQRALTEPVTGEPTSSSSQPSLMATMLEALEIRDGHRVVEIGTGTGYQAALLCHRLGAENVTTVEVDPALAAAARQRLGDIGYAPRVVVGDGLAGDPAGASYDRLIATCSVDRVPMAWCEQVRDGGIILASLHRPLGGGPLVRLTVEAGQASGRFLSGPGGFMPARGHGTAPAVGPLLQAALRTDPDHPPRTTSVPVEVFDDQHAGLVVAPRLRGVVRVRFMPSDGGAEQDWLLAAGGSWACRDVDTNEVTQRGRPLWDELERVWTQWMAAGCPPRERIGLTVTATGEHQYWLGSADHVAWRDTR